MQRLFPPDKMAGSFRLPVSKSMFNRALVISVQTGQGIEAPSGELPEDCRVMIQYLHSCGFQVSAEGGLWRISGRAEAGKSVPSDLGMAGTAFRFLTALATVLPVNSRFTGAERLGERPFLPLAMALQNAGAVLEWQPGKNVLPVEVQGNPDWQPGNIRLAHIQSSQMISALLLLGPHFNTGTTLEIAKDFPLSEPYVRMTLHMLQHQGIHWQVRDEAYILASKSQGLVPVSVEPDWSAVSYLLGLLLLVGGTIELRQLRPESCQGDAAQLMFFDRLGLRYEFTEQGMKACSDGLPYSGFEFDFSDMPDLAQTFAVLAAMANSPSRLTGLESLSLKETDRIKALDQELRKLNACVNLIPGGMEIIPGHLPEQVEIDTYNDHRMAMAFSLAAVRIPGLGIQNPAVVEKSFPQYWQALEKAGFRIES